MYLLLAAGLVGGTVNSLDAAPRKSGATPENHSTTVNNRKKSTGSNQVEQHARRTGEQPRAETSSRTVARKQDAGHSRLASRAQSSTASPVAPSPRATSGSSSNRRRSTTTSSTPDEAAIRAALARRQAWNEPRRTLSPQPAQVQDPPATKAAEAAAFSEESVLLASAKGSEGAENEDLIREALKQRGKPYIWGGASRGGFDCSGFVCYIYKTMRGMNLPHSASAQSRLGNPVDRKELRPGDLVFFSTYRRGISHVGIYIGENKFIHAANTRKDVRIDSLTGYYHQRYRSARRLTDKPIELNQKELDRLTDDSSELPQQNQQ